MDNDVIKIEQTLDEPKRFLFLPMDEALVLLVPFVGGFLGRKIFLGILLAILSYSFLKKIKGDGGNAVFLAMLYWYIPKEITPFRNLPDSSLEVWKG